MRVSPCVAVVVGAAWAVTACSIGADAPEEPTTLSGALGLEADPFGADAETVELAEDTVAACMIDKGWEYIPFGIEPVNMGFPTDEENLVVVEAQGLGVVSQYLNGGMGVSIGPNDEPVDPNAAYLDGLTDSERDAWNEALYGTEEEQEAQMATINVVDPSNGSEMALVASRAGCIGLAYDLLYGDAGQPDDVVEALRVHSEALQAKVNADPRTIALETVWADCMAASGYEYENEEDFWSTAYYDFTARADEIVGPGYEKDPMAGWSEEKITEFFATATEEEVDALFAGPASTLTADQRSRLEALQDEEIAVALAAHECTAANRPEEAEIAADVEEQYLREHEDELAAIAASMAEQEQGDKSK